MFPLMKIPCISIVGFCSMLCITYTTGTSAADPYITVHPKSRHWSVSNRSPQELLCAAKGSHEIKIWWWKDGKPIGRNRTSDARIWLVDPVRKDGAYFSPLHFNRVQKSDEGRYECMARNLKGSATSTSAKLTVHGPPSVNSGNPVPKEISVAWYDTFSLQCSGKGPPAITKVIWNYEVYNESNDTPFIWGTQRKFPDTATLTSLPREDDARLRHAIKYEVFCTVYNDEGSQSSSNTTINIKQKPGVPTIKEISPLDLGRVVTLNWEPGSDGFDTMSCFADVRNGKEFVKTMQLQLDGNKNEYIRYIEGLQPATSYTVRIQCQNSIGTSEWTPIRSFTTKEGYPDQGPRSVKVTAINSTALNITWSPIPSDHVFGNLLGYTAKVISRGELVKIITTGPDQLEVQISKLTPGHMYCGSVLGFTRPRDGEVSQLDCVTLPVNPAIIKNITTTAHAQRAVTFTYVGRDNESGAPQNCSILLVDMDQHEIRVPSISVSHKVAERTVQNLLPNTRYEARIACPSGKGDIYSTKYIFRTPEEKPQISPKNLHVTSDKHRLIASWDPIDVDSIKSGNFSGYNVCIIPAEGLGSPRCNMTLDFANHTFANVDPSRMYTVTVAACTNAGCGHHAYQVITMSPWVMSTPEPVPLNTTIVPKTGAAIVEGHFNFVYVYTAIAIIAVFLLAIGIVLFALYLRKRKQRKEGQQRNGLTVAYTPDQHPRATVHASSSPSNTSTINSYEVPLLSHRPLLSHETLVKLDGIKFTRDRLLLGDRLGKGEFGRVYKAKFRPLHPTGEEDEEGNLEVAVKTMIMDEYDASEREEFVKEGLRMRDMDHPNVMRLIGICLPEEASGGHTWTRVLSGFEAISPLVVVPCMPNGDLKHYLYNARIENKAKHITLNKLLHFACDIANGMEYLSTKNIVHRDLACRNCMLDSNMNVVVSDFGLSRQIYSSNYYRQKRAAKMPVKWMALESLLDRIYTTMTDVWSFGVTAWEIFTFCQNPYPGVQNHEMHELLKAGTRLKQPKGCPNDIWNDVIFPCWDPRPEERPTFAELVKKFSEYLKIYPHDFESEGSSVYVNVLSSDGYETLATPDEPLLRSRTISSENDEVPIPYDSAIERSVNGKPQQKQGRERSSSKKTLLNKEQHDVPSSSNARDLPRQSRDRSSSKNPLLGRKRKDTYGEEFVVEL